MPRIDPLQLLNCLTVLLNPNGGILSKNEVHRLASLMTKFSKKLVSKCVYILILKSTEKQLLGQFMLEGGWNLVHLWMQDGINNQNWPLVKELLELLLMAPTDIEQLKTNNLPKLVKSLTKRDDTFNIGELSNELVENWLRIVKESQSKPLSTIPNNNILSTIGGFEELTGIKAEQTVEKQPKIEKVETLKIVTVKKTDDNSVSQQAESYKVALRDGKAVLCKIAKVEPSEDGIKEEKEEERVEVKVETVEDKVDGKKKSELSEKKEKSNHDRHKSRSSSKSSSSSSRDKEKERNNKDKSSSKDKDKTKSSSSSRDKSRSDKDKHRSNGSVKSNSKSSSKDKKDSKEKQAEKDKDTLSKIQPQALQKIGRIPKKDEKSKEETKKPTFSIEVRKGTEEKPKTVKIYNAKMRSTGLLDEPKPPPPRIPKKPVAPLTNIPPPKRPSPPREIIPPPEKKSRIEPTERPGSIKLIPPKPKPAVLQESDIFMDALTASATTKKEPKKRKRRASVSKDAPSSPTEESSSGPTTPTTSLITPANFYQDTLNTENGEKTQTKEDGKDEDGSSTPTDAEGKMEVDDKEPKELKGVLVHVKKKGPKRSIRWKADSELVEVQYFELDETERINVYKTFGEMSKMEMCGERQALQMSRNRQIPIDDNMEPKTHWRHPVEIDVKPPLVEPGVKSLEKDIQFAREKTTVSLPPFLRLADTPAEPDPEVHQMTDPITIPLEDPESGESADTTPQPWPEPKGSPPHVPQVPQIFPIQPPFPNFNMPNQVPPQQFPNGPFTPNFMPPNMLPGNINMMNGPNMMPNVPPEMINPNNMFQGPKPDNFNPTEFPQFNQNQNMMFPQNNFNMRGRGGFRGRGMSGNGPWVRMNGPTPGTWNQRGGGMPRGAPPGRICKNVRNHGYCRNSNNCPFFHPN